MNTLFLPNYFTIGSLVSTLFFSYIFFVFNRVQNASHATKYLKWMVFSMVIFNLSYVITHGFSEYPTIWTRWTNIIIALYGTVQACMFFFHFPTSTRQKFAKGLEFFLYAGVGIVAIWLVVVFWNAPFYYIFNSHFWDSETLSEQKLAGIIIFTYMILTMIVGIWRSIVQKGAGRGTVIAILVSTFIVLVVPGLLHVLSRDGLAERSTYMTSTVILNLLGFFFIVIIYINRTTDKTSILDRLIGITLVTVFLILQTVSYFYIQSVESSFDREQIALAKETFVENRKHPMENYRIVYDPSLDTITSFTGEIEPAVLDTRLRISRNTSYLLTIANLNPENFPKNLYSFLAGCNQDFSGYAGWIRKLVQDGSVKTPTELVDAILKKSNRIRYLNSKIRPIPESDWKQQGKPLLDSLTTQLPGFAEAIGYDKENPNLDTISKNYVVRKLTPIRFPEIRDYSGRIEYSPGTEKPRFSIVYSSLLSWNGKKVLLETGLDYLQYRKMIASSGWTLIGIILSSYVLILLGFRFFFGGALLDPIQRLVNGLKQVNNGNLDVNLAIQVEDEIGFMTRSFNNMTWSIKTSQEKLKEYAEHLEEKVQERTKELSETLKKVQELKQQQDGDYFLTKLLLEPLGFSEVNSPFIKLESFVKQKKHFTFRNWSNDIGGDINIAHQIILNGKSHIAFVNADAMGKSMQGAGGALVLGSVFHAILDRTEMTPSMQMLYPEKWLKNLFIELHKVFESFNGSMLMSGFFGLLDEESGFLYYLNCEHPKGVLYRDGKASFFEKDVVLRKLGTSSVEGTLKIETFQMELGDILLLGSDGRDDILLSYDEQGGRIINEDENLFLEVVEEAKGEIRKIVEILQSKGELTDDLSLMRIERYATPRTIDSEKKEGIRETISQANQFIEKAEYEEAIRLLENYSQNNPVSPEILKALAKLHYQIQNFEHAAKYAQEYLFMKPSDHEFLYFASLCFRRIRNFNKSIDLSERLRLRNLIFSKNLGLLADLHLKTGNLKRAQAIYEELREIDPENQMTKYLGEKLSSAS